MRTSLLAPSSRVLCLHIRPKTLSNASPDDAPTPTPTAIVLLDEDGDSWQAAGFDEVAAIVDGAAVDVPVTVIMLLRGKAVPDVVTVTVTVTMSVLLGEVEPDVRLNITLPASTKNGAKLPRVLLIHSLLDELPGPQQNNLSRGKTPTPQLVLTRKRRYEHK